MKILSREEIIRQTAYLGYYFHWSEEDILKLPHSDRKRYLDEISRINRKLNGGGGNLFEL